MALRHAILAALLDGEYSGYQLTKIFSTAVSNFWHALPQQLYAELPRLQQAGFITNREVRQTGRPSKWVHRITDAGREELVRFAEAPSKPSFIRDELLVKVQAEGVSPATSLIEQLRARADEARARKSVFEGLMERILNGQDEREFLANNPRVGPYLTCRRGVMFEREQLEWCTWAANVLESRASKHPDGEPATNWLTSSSNEKSTFC